jgi:ABC-2 type transport system ATP-binding protein
VTSFEAVDASVRTSYGGTSSSRAAGSSAGRAEPILSIRGLLVRYRDAESDAISGVSLAIGEEKVVIVGPNGSGKSTLLKAVLGLAPVTSGIVEVLGSDVRAIRGATAVSTNLEEVYRLMTVPVGKLIAIWAGLKGGAPTQVMQWFDDFGLQGVLARPTFRLSTGQMKLVGNLLALAFDPQLVLLDEPFDNLDFGRRRKYAELLRRTSATVIMNTHELDLLHLFPDWGLYFMFDGQLIGRFRAGDIDRLYVNRGAVAGSLGAFATPVGTISVTLDRGDLPLKGISNLGYLLDRLS